ncbi:MAG: pro-sigmaK processing inhibitor BofA family protein [Bacillota bacterium]
MEWKFAFAALMVVFLLVVAAVFMLKPVKILIRLFTCAVVGTLVILLANVLLAHFGMRIAINPATVLTVGLLNIPGAILLVVLNYFFVQG